MVEERLDLGLSLAMARRVRAQYRRCWRNAARAVRHVGAGAAYVEGWVVVHAPNPMVIEHGWCEANDRIIDPTYTSYVSLLDPPLAYFAGRRFGCLEAETAVEQRNLPIVRSPHDDEYQRAFEAAWRDAAHRLSREPRPKTRVVHCRRAPADVFIGRPSQWAGPFHFGRDGTRAEVIQKFRHWLIRQPVLLREVRTLRGHALGCDCAPEPCHGDVLAELADMGHEDVCLALTRS